jgi:hypothetical protein
MSNLSVSGSTLVAVSHTVAAVVLVISQLIGEGDLGARSLMSEETKSRGNGKLG